MTDEQKIQLLVNALNKINKIVFATSGTLTQEQYFDIRFAAVNSIKAVDKEVE